LQDLADFKCTPPDDILRSIQLDKAKNVSFSCPVSPPMHKEVIIMNKVFKIMLRA
jgi:hypothetical protein